MKKALQIATVIVLCVAVGILSFVATSVIERASYENKLDNIHNLYKTQTDELQNAYDKALEELEAEYSGSSALADALRILAEARYYVDKQYVFDVDNEKIEAALKQAVYDIAVAGTVDKAEIQSYLLDAYFDAIEDPYTLYHTPEEMAALADESSGKLYGIGVYVYFEPDTGYIIIDHIMKNSPAEKAGLAVGDLITTIEGKACTKETYAECVALVAGELGTPVKLTIQRNGETTEISPIRGEVVTQSVYLSYIGDYAYIELMDFVSETIESDFAAALTEAEAKGIKGYIFDVRDNPGGDLNVICSVLDKLLPEGPIINVMNSEHQKVYSRTSDAACITKPMAVLCNGETASAGELFTAALKDYKIATIIGTTTFGKGTMQQIHTLSDGSGVRVSSYYYDPPYSENYHLKGIEPNITVEEPEEYTTHKYLRGGEGDVQLQAAIAALDKTVADAGNN